MAKADPKTVEARVLHDFSDNDRDYKVNEVASFDAETAKALAAAHCVDPHPEAVAYAKSLVEPAAQ